MNLVLQQMRYAQATGLCPVCRQRKRAYWKDGSGLRMTCGNPVCFERWLPGRHVLLADAIAGRVAATEPIPIGETEEHHDQ